jgi:hypothetical protein
MHGAKALFVLALVALVVAAGVFTFVPSLRPGPVKKWFRTASGFTPATSPEDALDKFKRALEKRDFETAALYCSGDYKEFIEKGSGDGKEIGDAVDALRAVMKDHGVKSDKAEFMLFSLDPFPPFKIENVKKDGEEKATAQLNWTEEVLKHAGQGNPGWQINPRIYTSMLPRVASNIPLDVALKKGADGSWTVVLPVQVVERHMRDQIEYLRKNATNYRNALASLKTDVKNDPATKEKENFEKALQTKLEGASK